MRILIAGDSFASNWYPKYKEKGWPNYLEEIFEVTNIAQAGCSEYKIYKQLQSINLKKFDLIIICHTSPYRIYCKEHIIHNKDILHKNSDYIYTDIIEGISKNSDLNVLKEYFEKFYDLEHAEFVHNLICKEIESFISNLPVLNISFFDYSKLHSFKNFIDLSQLFVDERGLINHLTTAGNKATFDKIHNWLTKT
jgi:hypothetical protein